MNFKLRSISLIVALFILATIAAIAGNTLFLIPGGSQRSMTTDYVVPVISNPTSGYLVPTIATFSIPQHTAVKIPTLPTGTKQVRVYVNPGAGANIGPSTVASGTTYPEVASSSLSNPIAVGTLTPSIYLIGRTAAATGTLLCE
jgi:hypothetical protein